MPDDETRKKTLVFDGTVLNENGRQIANDLAGLRIGYETPSGPMMGDPCDITPAIVLAEATRIAALPDQAQRLEEIRQLIAFLVELSRKSQVTARWALRADTSLQKLPELLRSLETATVRAVKPIGRDSQDNG